MWDLIYLDWDRVRSTAVELGAGGLMHDQGDAGKSRSLQTSVFRTVKESLAAGGKVVPIGAGFNFATWTPELFKDGQIVQISTAPAAGGGESGEGGGARGLVRLLDYPW